MPPPIFSRKETTMKAQTKIFVFLLIALMLVIQAVPVSAQGNPPPPNQLTPAQMKNAVMVRDGSVASRSSVKAEVYRFADCDGSDSDAPCYFIVTGNGTFVEGSNRLSVTPLSSSATLTCGVNVYNSFGNKVARLQQNVNVTFWSTYGQTPVTLNWGNLGGTQAYYGFYVSWSGLTGPTPNPGWGVYVSRAGAAYTTAGGLLTYAPPLTPGWQQYYSSRLTIRSSGWYCS